MRLFIRALGSRPSGRSMALCLRPLCLSRIAKKTTTNDALPTSMTPRHVHNPPLQASYPTTTPQAHLPPRLAAYSTRKVRGHRGVTRPSRREAVQLEANRAASRRGCGRRVVWFSRFGYVKVREDSSRVSLSAWRNRHGVLARECRRYRESGDPAMWLMTQVLV